MEPLFIVVKLLTVAWLGAIPTSPTTVEGHVEVSYVSNVAALSVESVPIEPAAVTAAAVPQETTTQKEGLQLPLPSQSYSFTSNYGSRCPPIRGASSFHRAVDLAAGYGTPLYAITNGTVTKVVDGSDNVNGVVIISSTINGERIDFLYMHMENSSQFVKVGDVVTGGQQISAVASTGVSTGNHLHFEVHPGGYGIGSVVNPEDWFAQVGLPVIQNARTVTIQKEATTCNAPAPAPRPAPVAVTPVPTVVAPTAPAPVAVTPAPTPVPTVVAPTAPAPVAVTPAPTPAPAAPTPATSTPAPVATPRSTPTPVAVTPSPEPAS